MQKIALLVIGLVLLSGLAIAAIDTETATASVTVNSYVSITLTDLNAAGIAFSSLNPGTSNNPADQNAINGTVRITNDAVSNVIVNLYVKGDNFTGPAALAVTNVDFNTSNVTPGIALATTYVDTGVNLASSTSQELWYWIDIPSAQTAGSYTSTFGFKGDTA